MNANSQIQTPSLDVFQVYEETGRLLLTPQMLAEQAKSPGKYPLPDADFQALMETSQWIRDFIMKVVQKSATLSEAVCPFARPSVEANLMYLSVGKPEDPDDRASVTREVETYLHLFNRLEPKEPPKSLLRAIVMVLPETPGELILPAVDLENTPIKTQLLENDIMIGEFFKDCPFTATWDETLFPLQSPLPFYAYRTFIESDWRFIHRVAAWRKLYKDRFGEPPQGDPYAWRALPQRLANLLNELSKKSRGIFESMPE